MENKHFVCNCCEEPCEAVKVDMGIGPYEYWGQDCFHKDYQWVSDCCHEDYVDRLHGEYDE